MTENSPFTAHQAVATTLVDGMVSVAFSTFKLSILFQYGIWRREFGTKAIVVEATLKSPSSPARWPYRSSSGGRSSC